MSRKKNRNRPVVETEQPEATAANAMIDQQNHQETSPEAGGVMTEEKHVAPRGARATDRSEKGRRQRVPLGTPQPKLAAPHRPGYVRRFVNDWPGRLENALNAGYEHVYDETAEDAEGRAPYREEIVGVNDDGSALHSYLMEIPEEYYQEDQMVKEAPLKQFDEELRRGNIREATPGDEEKYYVPKQGISVRTD